MLTFPLLPMTGPVVLEALRGFSGSTCSPTTTPSDLGTRPPRAQPGAAIAFLIAGPLTTVPAMAAVWGVVSPAWSPRVFALYVGLRLVGSVLLGLATDLLL
jgi:uncharacterized membrane protein YraQ (UPF0718 family)